MSVILLHAFIFVSLRNELYNCNFILKLNTLSQPLKQWKRSYKLSSK